MLSMSTRDLFGGAITASLPSDWIDCASVRPVPDNQEVFMSRDDSPDSLIVELQEVTELPAANGGGASLAAFYLSELAELEVAISLNPEGVVQLDAADAPVLAACGGSSYAQCIMGTLQLPRAASSAAGVGATEGSKGPTTLFVHMAVLRLEGGAQSDVVVTTYTLNAQRRDLCRQRLLALVRSLVIADFGLFVSE